MKSVKKTKNAKKPTSLSLEYFPNLQAAGQYDLINQLITINSFDNDSLKSLIEINNLVKAKNKLNVMQVKTLQHFTTTLQHELTHWLDMSSTIWGLNWLNSLYESIDTFLFTKIETDFIKIKRFLDSMQHLRYSNYYNETYDNITDLSKPWSYQFSTGQLFKITGELSSEPILFTNFFNSSNSKFVRYPISIGSLLEGSALAQEFSLDFNLLDHLNEDDKIVEKNLCSKKWLDRIYDRDLLIYSSIPHLVSNLLKLPDIGRTLMFVSVLTRLVLNFPDNLFSKIVIPKSQKHEPWGNRLKDAMLYKSRPILFYLIADNINLKNSKKEIGLEDIKSDILTALNFLGIEKSTLDNEYASQMITTTEEFAILCGRLSKKMSSDYFEKFMNASLKNISQLGLWGNISYDFDALITPPFLLGDSSVHYLSKSFSFDTETHYENMFVADKKINEFKLACIG